MLREFKVIIWKQSLSLSTFDTILRKWEKAVELIEDKALPKDFDLAVLESASKGISLHDIFNTGKVWGTYEMSQYITSEVLKQIGDLGKTASRIVIELSPGIWSTVVNNIGKLPSNFAYNDFEVTDLTGSCYEQKDSE